MKEICITRISRKGKIATNVILGVISIFWLFPILFAVIESMKTKQEYNLSFFWELPNKISWLENLKYIIEYSTIFQSIKNSLIYSFCGSIGSILISLFAAYALTKLKIRGKMIWFMIIYSGTIFPFQLYLIPIFTAYQKIGLYDTMLGMAIFYIAICIPFAMFVLRNFFLGISNDLIMAAKIDGASDMLVLWKILVPIAKAPLSVIFLTQFSWCYNELMFGITFTKSNDIKPIMATISTFTANVPAMLVASGIASVVTILLYFTLNKNFDRGISYQNK